MKRFIIDKTKVVAQISAKVFKFNYCNQVVISIFWLYSEFSYISFEPLDWLKYKRLPDN